MRPGPGAANQHCLADVRSVGEIHHFVLLRLNSAVVPCTFRHAAAAAAEARLETIQ